MEATISIGKWQLLNLLSKLIKQHTDFGGGEAS